MNIQLFLFFVLIFFHLSGAFFFFNKAYAVSFVNRNHKKKNNLFFQIIIFRFDIVLLKNESATFSNSFNCFAFICVGITYLW